MLKRVERVNSAVGALYRRSTLNQISSLMGVLGLFLIVATASYMTWNERTVLFEEGREHADRSAYFLADHAQRLFEVSDIALRATQAATGDKDWDAIEHAPDIKASLGSINAILPYVADIWLADQNGRVRLSTVADLPANYSVSDRRAFQDSRTPGDRLIVGDPIIGHISQKPTFLVARRIEASDGSFRGMVAVTMSLAYFTSYWQQLDIRNDERVLLVRDGNGSILARYPEETQAGSGERIGSSIVAAAQDAGAGFVQPAAHEFGYYHRIGNLPVFVAVVFKDAAINAAWKHWVWGFAPFVLGAVLVLAAFMALGRRLAERESRNRLEIETARTMLGASNVRLEQRVAERTADLQETNQEIQRFAYIVSHDLRAPLVNIMGFTSELESLRSDLFGAGDAAPGGGTTEQASRVRDDFDEAIGFIKSSIDKMDRLIKAILSLSRQGQRRFKPEPLDMDAVMRSIADGVAHRLQQSGATLTIGSLPPIVADRIAIEQVFSNLIDNAVKYLRADKPGRIEVTARTSVTTVTFEVRDNGRGIDPKDRERVFDLFRRAGAQDQPGEGIGLANVRSLVRRLQGTITLDSTLGLGCVFTITLPKFGTEPGDDPQ